MVEKLTAAEPKAEPEKRQQAPAAGGEKPGAWFCFLAKGGSQVLFMKTPPKNLRSMDWHPFDCAGSKAGRWIQQALVASARQVPLQTLLWEPPGNSPSKGKGWAWLTSTYNHVNTTTAPCLTTGAATWQLCAPRRIT